MNHLVFVFASICTIVPSIDGVHTAQQTLKTAEAALRAEGAEVVVACTKEMFTALAEKRAELDQNLKIIYAPGSVLAVVREVLDYCESPKVMFLNPGDTVADPALFAQLDNLSAGVDVLQIPVQLRGAGVDNQDIRFSNKHLGEKPTSHIAANHYLDLPLQQPELLEAVVNGRISLELVGKVFARTSLLGGMDVLVGIPSIQRSDARFFFGWDAALCYIAMREARSYRYAEQYGILSARASRLLLTNMSTESKIQAIQDFDLLITSAFPIAAYDQLQRLVARLRAFIDWEVMTAGPFLACGDPDDARLVEWLQEHQYFVSEHAKMFLPQCQ